MHYGVIAMMAQFEEGMPSFLFGNSMGCMILNTFLLRNPNLKISGVMFSAPFFGLRAELGVGMDKIFLMKALDPIFKVSADV